jgi:hypothetical protein
MGKVANSRTDVCRISNRDIQVHDIPATQNATEVPPWAESYEISSTEVDGMVDYLKAFPQ